MVHTCALVLDGVSTSASPFSRAVFHPAAPLEDEDVECLTRVLQRRITRYLQRGGHLPREEQGEASQPEPEEPLLAEFAAASIQGRVALGAKRGGPVSRLPPRTSTGSRSTPRCW